MYDSIAHFRQSVTDKKFHKLIVTKRDFNTLYASLHQGTGSESFPFLDACITSDTPGYAECLAQLGYDTEGRRL